MSKTNTERARAPKMLKSMGYAAGGVVKAAEPMAKAAPVKKAFGGPMPAPQMAPPGAPAMRPNLGRAMRPGVEAPIMAESMAYKHGGKVKC
jgi:hypothetical protein